jgi:hypothetical protein
VVGLAVVAVLVVLIPYSTLRGANGVSFSLRPYKVPAENWDIAVAAAKATGPGESLLAPEAISAWVPLMERRPKLVSVREIYDELMPAFVPVDEARERRELRELVTGGMVADGRIEPLLNLLPRYGVGVVVTSRLGDAKLTGALVRRGYVSTLGQRDYVVYVLSDERHRDWILVRLFHRVFGTAQVNVWFASIFSEIQKQENFYRFDLFAEQGLWLECGNGRSLWTHRAGLIGNRGILLQRWRWIASFGGKCWGFSSTCSTSTALHARLSDLPRSG